MSLRCIIIIIGCVLTKPWAFLKGDNKETKNNHHRDWGPLCVQKLAVYNDA